jgi:uncharacterized membrane protein YebE (DUF533 family)
VALLASLALASLRGPEEAQATRSSDDPAQDAPLGLREPQTPGEEQELQDKASLIISAMINAAKADGAIDQNEAQRTVGKLEAAGADPQTRQLIAGCSSPWIDFDSLAHLGTIPSSSSKWDSCDCVSTLAS